MFHEIEQMRFECGVYLHKNLQVAQEKFKKKHRAPARIAPMPVRVFLDANGPIF